MVRFTPGCNCCDDPGNCDIPDQDCGICNDAGIPDVDDPIFADMANMTDFSVRAVNPPFTSWIGTNYWDGTFELQPLGRDNDASPTCCVWQFAERVTNPFFVALSGDTPFADNFLTVNLNDNPLQSAAVVTIQQLLYDDGGVLVTCTRTAQFNATTQTACQTLDYDAFGLPIVGQQGVCFNIQPPASTFAETIRVYL